MLLSRAVPLAILVAVAACAKPAVLRLDTTLRPRTNPDSIRLLVGEPQKPYTVIALVSAVGKVEVAREHLIKAAARLGGDAVLLGAGALTQVGTGGEYGGLSPQLSGKVIVFNREAQSN